MGLDTVELVLAIEDEFGIDIPDTDAPKLGVLGDLNDYIVRALRRKGEAPDEEQVWQQLTGIVIRQLGVSPEQVTRAADIVRDLKAD